MGRLSDVRARLDCFAEIAGQLETLQAEMEWVAAESSHASLVQLWCSYGAHAGRYLPLSLAPILDRPPLHAGIAVGWHGAPLPGDAPVDLRDYAERLLTGRLIHAAKQYDTTPWETDAQDVQAIGHLAAYALASTHFGRQVDLLASVPSSRGTNALPHRIVRDLRFLTRIRHAPIDAIRFERHVSQVKDIRDYWNKQEALDGAMWADPAAMRGRYVLLVDAVCRTGATLHECARACFHAGAVRVTALAVSKTFRFQRVPEPLDSDDAPWAGAR